MAVGRDIESNRFYVTEELNSMGYGSRSISELVTRGKLERMKRGLYRPSEMESDGLTEACRMVDNGVLCGLSALAYHGLSTINPMSYELAIPRNASIPSLPTSAAIRLRRYATPAFELGLETASHMGEAIRIYNRERALCDAFRLKRQIEHAVAMEALRSYMAGRGRNLPRLIEYAKRLRVYNTIGPYMEALL